MFSVYTQPVSNTGSTNVHGTTCSTSVPAFCTARQHGKAGPAACAVVHMSMHLVMDIMQLDAMDIMHGHPSPLFPASQHHYDMQQH